MPLKILFAIFSALLLLGCVEHPNKPVVTLCQLDVPGWQGLCGKTGQGGNTKAKPVPMQELDKSTCFPKEDWKKVKDYVDSLDAYIHFLEDKLKGR
jgi:hypothetical protein